VLGIEARQGRPISSSERVLAGKSRLIGRKVSFGVNKYFFQLP